MQAYFTIASDPFECSPFRTRNFDFSKDLPYSEFDCPPFPKMFRTVCAIGGASITAADELGQGYYQVRVCRLFMCKCALLKGSSFYRNCDARTKFI